MTVGLWGGKLGEAQLRAYIEDWVMTGKGCMHPEDAIQEINTCRVVRYQRINKEGV